MKDKPLMGVVLYGHAKDYVYPKWLEMYEACCKDFVDVVFVSERQIDSFETLISPIPGWTSEDMLIVARDLIRLWAIKEEYPAMIWQGIDCLYDSPRDFQRLLSGQKEYRAVGGLTTARMDASYAICRRFVWENGVPTTKQEEWEDNVLEEAVMQHGMINAGGFVGADALLIDQTLFRYSFADHIPWYKRVEMGLDNVCAEEEWCRRVLIDHPDALWLDASVRTWHIHEDGIAKRWPGITCHMNDISY